MRNVHALTWVGVVVNVVVCFFGLVEVNDGKGPSMLIALFNIVFIGGILLQIVGLGLLLAGKRAGGVLGAVGAIAYVPIGLLAAHGFLRSRDLLYRQAYAAPPGAAVSVRTHAVPNRMDAAAVQTLAPEGVALSPASPAAAPDPGRAAPISTAAPDPAAPLWATEAESAVEAEPASIRYNFADQSGVSCLAIVVVVIGVIILIAQSRNFPTTMVLFAAIIVFKCAAIARTADLPAFAFYGDYLEFTPNMYASPLQVPYADILAVDMQHERYAKLEVRRVDGGVDSKARVDFNLIKGSERDEAREAFRQKMLELGKLKESEI